jgi:N-acylneuraminate cytidylyltransferase
MKGGVSVFLPTRKGSERVVNKNTRTFAGIKGGLLSIKLQQLLKVKSIDEIILSTNDEASVEVASDFTHKKLKVVKRPENLALTSTNLQDLIDYAPGVCSCDNILWTHVTSPFTNDGHYERAINEYEKLLASRKFDSLMSGNWFKNFLWSQEKNEVINKDSDLKWPRTQDLSNLFEVDSAIFIANKRVYQREQDRIGKRPYLFTQKGNASFDIDWEDDFRLAEILYKYDN